MKQVTSADILGQLNDRAARGHHIDDRLNQSVRAQGNLFLFTLDDEDSFLSLIWQEIDPSRLLTPRGQPRTLGDVANRMIEESWTFESLSNPMGLPPTQHVPSAFESFETINSAFDFAEFNFIAVVAANDSERRQSPSGTFYIYDGVHRSLVFAHRVLTKQTSYRPIEVLLITPRRD
jgi:hypothetical protein